jgi:hypothetical protein
MGRTKALERGEHRRALHGAAVVGVQHEFVPHHAFALTGRLHQGRCKVGRLGVVDLEGDDLADFGGT